MVPGGDRRKMLPFRIYPKEEMPLGSRDLRAGCSGRDVLALQRELMAAGYLSEADGKYGYVTEAAIRRLQAKCRLPRDGVAGSATIAGLQALREGSGFAAHRVRPGETGEEAAAAMGVGLETLRRQNSLSRRQKIPAGLLLTVSARSMLIETDREPPPALKCTGILGPPVNLTESGLVCGDPVDALCLPVLTADEEGWRRLLRQPRTWRGIAGEMNRLCLDKAWRHWAIGLPPRLWWQRRRLLKMLASWRQRGSAAPFPIVRWPLETEPWPDLAALAELSAFLFLDPGPLAFGAPQTARLLRQVTRVVPAPRLIIMFRGSGLFSIPGAGLTVKPVREARAEAIMARARLNWDETERVYLAARREPGESWDLRLLEERGLRDRVRLADRFDCAGVALGGLAGVALPSAGIWPGEFAVLDSFPPPRHIN